MKIGLDYGGVMDDDPNGWAETIRQLIDKGHQVYILSHAHPGQDEQRRQIMADQTGAINLTFSDTMDELVIRRRKAELVQQYGIELLIDDYIERCAAVQKDNPLCSCICAHYTRWSVAKRLLDGLGAD